MAQCALCSPAHTPAAPPAARTANESHARVEECVKGTGEEGRACRRRAKGRGAAVYSTLRWEERASVQQTAAAASRWKRCTERQCWQLPASPIKFNPIIPLTPLLSTPPHRARWLR